MQCFGEAMLVGEQSPAPRVVAGLRKLRPELTPGPVLLPVDPDFRISGWFLYHAPTYIQNYSKLPYFQFNARFFSKSKDGTFDFEKNRAEKNLNLDWFHRKKVMIISIHYIRLCFTIQVSWYLGTGTLPISCVSTVLLASAKK